MSETEQYVFGLKAGETLRKIHSLPAPEDAIPWGDWFYRKVQGRIDFYNINTIKSENGNIIVHFLQDNKHLLDNRPQTFTHGDFNKSNLMVMPDRQIGVIDFNAYNRDHGDPWWEFDPTNWGNEPNAHFCTGLINGYFDGTLPNEFFLMHRYYLAYDALAALCDTSVGIQGEPEEGRLHLNNVLRWFDNMNDPVPSWYLKDFYIQWIDGVPYKLEAPFDFSFIAKYGKVFKAFDEQGSGNISFGVQNGKEKYFVKFAGAPRKNYIANRDSGAVDATSAIALLKAAVPLYTELKHPALINFISAEEIGSGYAAVFGWTDASGIEPKGSPDYMRFMQMPTEKKIRAFEEIIGFHAHVAAKGYVALDFYDGSILYDYDKEKVIICDIDLYQKSPFRNVGNLGIVGSARYVSPEECVPDAVMDEITNVYTMGATAFALFAYGNRSPEAWPLDTALYDVVKKAISDDRDKRQQSIRQLIDEWRAAK
jgi:serine/threonine-protein kinase